MSLRGNRPWGDLRPLRRKADGFSVRCEAQTFPEVGFAHVTGFASRI